MGIMAINTHNQQPATASSRCHASPRGPRPRPANTIPSLGTSISPDRTNPHSHLPRTVGRFRPSSGHGNALSRSYPLSNAFQAKHTLRHVPLRPSGLCYFTQPPDGSITDSCVSQSKYRHVYGEKAKLHYENAKISGSAWDTDLVAAGGKYLAVNWQVSGGGVSLVTLEGSLDRPQDMGYLELTSTVRPLLSYPSSRHSSPPSPRASR
jgi:hypothetical protein